MLFEGDHAAKSQFSHGESIFGAGWPRHGNAHADGVTQQVDRISIRDHSCLLPEVPKLEDDHKLTGGLGEDLFSPRS